MDTFSIIVTLVFSSVGMGMFVYGKKQQSPMHMLSAAGLMTCPYFIANPIALLIVCILLTGLPFVDFGG